PTTAHSNSSSGAAGGFACGPSPSAQHSPPPKLWYNQTVTPDRARPRSRRQLPLAAHVLLMVAAALAVLAGLLWLLTSDRTSPLSDAPTDQIILEVIRLAFYAVAGIGVLGAATAGLWIARTGLKTVDRLTGAVEHVARTEDLAVRIPVEGGDEIARLSRSFNAMT
ncbi:hypothetical protein ADL26_07985, partial [Thermoactinomyces vulgaris]